MTCDELGHRLPEYWAGESSEAARLELERHLERCNACRHEAETLGALWSSLGSLSAAEPPVALASRFEDALARQTATAPSRVSPIDQGWRRARRPTLFQPAWGIAAALLVAVVGFAAGRSWPDTARQTELAELRGELKGMRQLVALSLLQQDSAADRLKGITWSADLDRPGAEVVSALLDTLQHDANVNVRLATIDALRQLGGSEPRVRAALVRGLLNDPSPLIQVALIDAVVALRERQSADTLRAIADNPGANEAVRQRARRGLRQLL